MSVYRPTVRYAPVFRDYVDALFRATTLDRNQIIRAALFAAAYSKEFEGILQHHKKKDVPLPEPLWNLSDHEYWLEQKPTEKGGKDVNADTTRGRENSIPSRNDLSRTTLQQNVLSSENRRITSSERREREISPKRHESIEIRERGGIIIRIG